MTRSGRRTGGQIVFASSRKGRFDLFRKTVGEGEEELVFESGEDKFSSNWLRDGSILFISFYGKAFYRLPPSGVGSRNWCLRASSRRTSRTSRPTAAMDRLQLQ